MKVYPRVTYTITFKDGQFTLVDNDGVLVAVDTNGRELGRLAWDCGAEKVVYDYDLGIDEHIPLKPRHAKYW